MPFLVDICKPISITFRLFVDWAWPYSIAILNYIILGFQKSEIPITGIQHIWKKHGFKHCTLGSRPLRCQNAHHKTCISCEKYSGFQIKGTHFATRVISADIFSLLRRMFHFIRLHPRTLGHTHTHTPYNPWDERNIYWHFIDLYIYIVVFMVFI